MLFRVHFKWSINFIACCRQVIGRNPTGPVLASLIFDSILTALSALVAFALLAGNGALSAWALLLLPAVYFGLTAAIFLWCGVERRVWRYFSRGDLQRLLGAIAYVSLAGAMLFGSILGGQGAAFSGKTLVLSLVGQWLLSVILLLGGRFAWLSIIRARRAPEAATADNARLVLLAGSGIECSLFLRSLGAVPGRLIAVGILDDDQIGRCVNGVPVLGRLEDLPQIMKGIALEQRPEQLILTRMLAEAPMARLAQDVQELGMGLAELSPPDAMLRCCAAGAPVEPFELHLLRGRPTAKLDFAALGASLSNRRILVTGAGGSIGSELVRLVASLGPASVTLLDNCEFNLYHIDRELGENFPQIRRTALLADIRDRRRLDMIFGVTRPEIVFHSAALKHVPMVEANLCEGVLSNVIGSRNVALAARAAGVAAMVQISTDKAVNPVSAMGATKRLAEIYCQALDVSAGVEHAPGQPSTRFMTVRFGNVWGSSGSVIPLFERQIEMGGPITVTHGEVERFFMTIREAAELVVQAVVAGMGSHSERGAIYVLDMGEPLRILDIARRMVETRGKHLGQEIKIEIVGLRPGEKLYEELFDRSETRLPGPARGILAARSAPHSFADTNDAVAEIERLAEAGDDEAVRGILSHMVPGFGCPSEHTDNQAAA